MNGMHGNVRNLAGQKFGDLTAIMPSGSYRYSVVWTCRCECGKSKNVRSCDLVSGNTRSCGCMTRSKFFRMSRQLEHLLGPVRVNA